MTDVVDSDQSSKIYIAPNIYLYAHQSGKIYTAPNSNVGFFSDCWDYVERRSDFLQLSNARRVEYSDIGIIYRFAKEGIDDSVAVYDFRLYPMVGPIVIHFPAYEIISLSKEISEQFKSAPSYYQKPLKYFMVRSKTAGTFFGRLESRNGAEVKLSCARRIYYWDGAASLSQLAMEGTKKPQNCRFPCEIDVLILTDANEIIEITRQDALDSLRSVPVWEAK